MLWSRSELPPGWRLCLCVVRDVAWAHATAVSALLSAHEPTLARLGVRCVAICGADGGSEDELSSSSFTERWAFELSGAPSVFFATRQELQATLVDHEMALVLVGAGRAGKTVGLGAAVEAEAMHIQKIAVKAADASMGAAKRRRERKRTLGHLDDAVSMLLQAVGQVVW